MNTHKAFILGVALLSTIGVKAQFAIDNYKAVFTSSPQHVPTTKTPDAPLAGNGDIGITMGGTPDKLCFYIGKNDFWRAYPVYPGGIALPGGLDIEIKELQGATYYAEQLPGSAEIRTKFTTPHCQLNLSAWVAATDNKIIIELQSDKAVTAHLRLWAAEGNTSTTAGGKDKVMWVSRSFENTELLRWPTHVALALNSNSDEFSLIPGKKVQLVISVYTNHDTPDWKNKAITEAEKVTDCSMHAWGRLIPPLAGNW